jgi:hypothetical protein
MCARAYTLPRNCVLHGCAWWEQRPIIQELKRHYTACGKQQVATLARYMKLEWRTEDAPPEFEGLPQVIHLF